MENNIKKSFLLPSLETSQKRQEHLARKVTKVNEKFDQKINSKRKEFLKQLELLESDTEKYEQLKETANFKLFTLKEEKNKKIQNILRDKFWVYTFLSKFVNTRKYLTNEIIEQDVQYKKFTNGKKQKIVASIEDLVLYFTNPSNMYDKNLVLRGPSIDFYEGKVHAIIGESGSGKSVITSLLYGLAGNNAVIDSGKVKLYNKEVQNFTFEDWEKSNYRGKIISAVFQNPMSTLNPTMKIGTQIIEGMLINGITKSKKEAKKLAVEYLQLTKIANPKEVMKLYPHELSGGMIQRVVIAAIISMKPKIIVMDEPTTALDPTVQALVLDVVRELKEKFKITIIFITHDLGVVASLADYISIMYAGQIIEEGTRDEILNFPQHPYTWGLITSMPDVNNKERLSTIKGSVPSSLNEIKGDAFAVRNDYALERDFHVEPDFYFVSETHRVKSALLDKQAAKYNPPKLIKEKWNKWQNQSTKTEKGRK